MQALVITASTVAAQALFAHLFALSSPIKQPRDQVGSAKDAATVHNLDFRSAVSDERLSSAIKELNRRHLTLPIEGISADNLKGSFYEKRGDAVHEATDIPAARNTPVHAVEDGTIAKLFASRLGGNTIYQIDPSGQYVYYYAHLEKYEPSLKEGDRVKRGQIIGFVGTSGNAPPNTPHLHFSISILTNEKKWWQARALDPFEVFKSNKANTQ